MNWDNEPTGNEKCSRCTEKDREIERERNMLTISVVEHNELKDKVADAVKYIKESSCNVIGMQSTPCLETILEKLNIEVE